MRAISELGYEKPSPIQAETLPILLGEPTDFLGLAATGTGKTAAFAIPMLERIDPSVRRVQALVICPTRELAIQVSGQINLLGKYKGIRSLPIYGGSDYSTQIRGLKDGVSVVVGTPGRMVDHMERGTLRLDELQVVVLDEADEMISMGFKEDLETILGNAPRESSNIWLFSATMSSEVRRVADEYLQNPQFVQINRTEMLPKTVEQIFYMTQESNKPEVLCKLVDAAEDFYGLVFCQTKSLVTDLTQYLTNRRYKVDSLHGDKDQNARERTMQAFRDRKVNLLICTDVASRGLDVKDVTHVINYSIPRELDNYVHRIGRTARSGKTGFALNLVTPSHKGLIGRIEKMTKSRMREGKIPTRKEIGAKKVSQLLTKFQAQDTYARAIELLDQPWKDAIAKMSQEEITGRLLSMMFPEVFDASFDRESKAAENAKPIRVSSGHHERSHHEQRPRQERRENRFQRSEGSSRKDNYRSENHYGAPKESRREKPFKEGYPKRNRSRTSDWNRPLSRS
jgi:ATP-dependent RNA helicase DeaD